MKKISIAVTFALLVSGVQPAFADVKVSDQGKFVIEAANAFAPTTIALAPPLEAGLKTAQIEEANGIVVSAIFSSQDGVTRSFEMRPKYQSESTYYSNGRSTAISSEGRKVFVGTTSSSNIRIVTQTFSRADSKSIEYQTNLEQGTYLLPVTGIGLQILNADGIYLGTLAEPWAFDAKGRKLKTDLSLENSVLTQTIELDRHATYPITSDPNWGYSLDLMLNTSSGLEGAKLSKRSPAHVTTLLKSCFNCYFPVSGAPIWYPYVGQTMPLKIQRPLPPFDLMPAPVKVTNVFNYGWKFVALTGHVDGSGSTIQFVWYSDSSMNLHLSVIASIVNADPCGVSATLCQPAYPIVARLSWQKLFNNVTD